MQENLLFFYLFVYFISFYFWYKFPTTLLSSTSWFSANISTDVFIVLFDLESPWKLWISHLNISTWAMGTLSGIVFTSITPFTSFTPEGATGAGGGCNELNLFASTPPHSEQDVCVALYCIVFLGWLIKPKAGVQRETRVCNTKHYFCI